MKTADLIPEKLLRHPLWFYVRQNPRSLAVGMLFLAGTNILDGVWPLLIKRALDEVEAGLSLDQIGRTCLIFFAVMASLSITRYGWRQGFGRFHTLMGEDLRNRAFRHINRLSADFFLRKPVGDLMSVLTNDVQVFRRAMGAGLLVLFDGIMILIVLLPIMFHLNPRWTLGSLVLLPLVPVLIWFVMRKVQAASKQYQDSFSEVTAECEETVQGVRVLKGFALEDRWLSRFSTVSEKSRLAANRVAKIDSLFFPVMEFGVTSGTVIFLFIAKDDLISGAATLGTFVAFHRYIMKMVWPVTALGEGLSHFHKGFAAFERIGSVLQEQPTVKDDGIRLLERIDSVEFVGVGFRYPGTAAWALRDVSFRFHRGEVLGVLGPVGSGKTTLMNLLARLHDPTEGVILVNGHPLKDYTLASVRRAFHLIPQDVFLFSDSVLRNLGFARDEDITEADAVQASERVQLRSEIDGLPSRFGSILGEKGVNLSGGQKQRLTLARGFVSDSAMLILDDVLCSVDTRTESKISDELLKMKMRETSFWIVSHRLSTLSCADRLLILEDGRVEAFGNPTELLASSAILRKIEALQREEAREDGIA